MCVACLWSSTEAPGLQQGEPRGRRRRGGNKSWVLEDAVGLEKTILCAKIGSSLEALDRDSI